MRFDILDEHSTLVPFGLGVSKHNRVIQYPTVPAKTVRPGAIAIGTGRSKLVLKFVAVLRHIARREEIRPIH